MSFSQASLDRIRAELAEVPPVNPEFDVYLSSDEIRTRYLWHEGIEIACQNGQYVCTRQLERSTRTQVLEEESQAVDLFICVAGSQKRARILSSADI